MLLMQLDVSTLWGLLSPVPCEQPAGALDQ